MFIVKTPRCSDLAKRYVCQLLGRELRDKFYSNDPIEVDDEQFEKLKSKGWCNIWREKNG